MKISINKDRLQKEIDDLALITEAAPPVVTRVLFSESDLRGRAFVKNLCREAGLVLREDAVGNIFARWEGADKNLPAVATGSHIDAIPNAGKYDGVVGVLGAIEAIRALKAAGFQPKRSIELIIFTSEEPTRFGIGCLGSRLLGGVLSLERAAALRDRDGKDLEFWRAQTGLTGARLCEPQHSDNTRPLRVTDPRSDLSSVKLPRDCYAAFVELHIEQGPILEAENIDIGVVEKIAAPSTLRLQLTGVGGHAGATLMPGRRDALLAGAEIALAVEHAAQNTGSPDTVGTTGVFRIEPGAVNSVPCRAWLEIDLRDTLVKTRDAALVQIETAVKEICTHRKIEFTMERLNVDPPAICDAQLVATTEAVAKKLNFSVKRMVSRAYHDSLFMAQVCPTTMIFIPCYKGYSHRPDEFSSPEQIEKGVRVLAEVFAELASR
ncbi:MAG: hypothetical protein RLZZ350_1796 [Verrucomicrobiota bacterium]|jgi:N-carbamoyl-L-amino-acid hydrolase